MRITERTEADVTVLELNGALSLGPGEDAFRQKMNQLIESKQTRILIDFKQVELIDSSGVGALVKYLTSITRNGGRLVCTRPARTIEKVLKITGVYDLFEFHNDQKEALAAFHGG